MTNHPIVAAPWQLGRSLELILLPLVPEPRDCGLNWVWDCEPLDLFWFKSEGVGDRLLKKLPWQVGDRIYLQEPWCSIGEHYFTQSTTPEAEITGWQPAEMMPEAAATRWYEVDYVRVCQTEDLTRASLLQSGLLLREEDLLRPLQYDWSLEIRWNTTHPDHPWLGDRHIVALQVKPAIFETSKQK